MLHTFCFQVTKDKMLAEKDEELRRMQEMLAQMQVSSGTGPLVIVPILDPSATCVHPRLKPP